MAINPIFFLPQTGCLRVPPGRDRGRAVCSCVGKTANKSGGDCAQEVKRSGDGRERLNRCGDRRRPYGVGGYGRRGWDVSGDVSVGTVVVAQIGGVGVCAGSGETRAY